MALSLQDRWAGTKEFTGVEAACLICGLAPSPTNYIESLPVVRKIAAAYSEALHNCHLIFVFIFTGRLPSVHGEAVIKSIKSQVINNTKSRSKSEFDFEVDFDALFLSKDFHKLLRNFNTSDHDDAIQKSRNKIAGLLRTNRILKIKTTLKEITAPSRVHSHQNKRLLIECIVKWRLKLALIDDSTYAILNEHLFKAEVIHDWLGTSGMTSAFDFSASASATLKPNTDSVTPPMSRRKSQQKAILSELLGSGYDPKKLPPTEKGKKGIKNVIWRKCEPQRNIFISKNVFNKAWQELLNLDEIKVSNCP
jgi:hypothetical protein